MPPTIGHLPLLREREWEMAYFFVVAPNRQLLLGRGMGASGTQTEQQASKHGIVSCFGPAARRRGERSGRPPEKSPGFRRKIPVFRHKAPILQAEREKNGRKCIFLSCKLGQLRKMSYFCNRKREASPMPQRKTAAKHPLADDEASRSDVQWRGGGIGRRATLRG